MSALTYTQESVGEAFDPFGASEIFYDLVAESELMDEILRHISRLLRLERFVGPRLLSKELDDSLTESCSLQTIDARLVIHFTPPRYVCRAQLGQPDPS